MMIKYALKTYLLLVVYLVLLSLSACIDEQKISDGCIKNQPAANGININFTLETMQQAQVALKDYNTGDVSPRLDMNTINDINVVIYSSQSTTPTVYYYSNSTTHPASLTFPITSGSASFTIDYTNRVTGVYLVANYGTAIDPSSILTPEALQSLMVTLPTSGVPDKCVMFAQGQDLGTTTDGFRDMNAAFKRTLAMITVSLHGKNLYNGVKIKPTRISITNVPATVTIGGTGNKITSATEQRSGYYLVDSSWPTLVNNTTDSIIGYNTHGATNSLAFFTYENMQGNYSPVADQTNKKSDATQMPYATYITVDAQYSYSNGSTLYNGDIRYRFCLGTNLTTNYDVTRNTQYVVQLYLSGWGGAQEGGRVSNGTLVTGTGTGVNWRVNMNLYDFGFSNTDYNFDAHLSTGSLTTRGSCKFVSYKYDPAIDTTQLSQHWILTTRANDTWNRMVSGRADVIKDDAFTYFIKPWRYSDPGFPKTNTDRQYRECIITIQNTNGGNKQTVIFRQWAPIKLTNTLYLERFDEGKTSGASNLAWGFNNTSTLPSGFVYYTTGGADINAGFNNTQKIGLPSSNWSPAGRYVMQKGGYNVGQIYPNITTSQFKQAAYYLPTASDMDTVSVWVRDPFNPAHTNLDILDIGVDYWSSSSDNARGTYYWDHNSRLRTLTTGRTSSKKARAVYRPQFDTP